MSEENKNTALHWSDLASLLALALSIAALCVAILEATTTRRMATAEVWPYLTVGERYDSEGFYYEAVNKGIGPARLRSVIVKYQGEPIQGIDQLILDILGPEDAFSYDRYRSSVSATAVISAGEVLNLFSVDWDPVTRRLSQALAPSLEIEICYCSVYDDCWIAKRGANEALPVEQCPTLP